MAARTGLGKGKDVREIRSPISTRRRSGGNRGWKKRIYAAAHVPVYWIVNLVDRQVEVFTQPTGPGSQPSYASAAVFPAEDSVPVVWDGRQVGLIAVRHLLP